MKLVIVESPTKAETIKRFLDKTYKVFASYGHVRDLPKRHFGIDIKNNFKIKYQILEKAKKIIPNLKKNVKKSEITILATDEDREGESIAWHLKEILNLGRKYPYQRITFHEITKTAIEKALLNPREIDMNLVSAQKARRVLDRIVGYLLSPFLWKKVGKGLSAGRVQSPALRLIVEREREIEKFKPKEYWQITAILSKKDRKSDFFKAKLTKENGKRISKFYIDSKEKANKIENELRDKEWKVEKIEKREIKKEPLPPFTTSSLQQTAWRQFHWSSKFTMRIAQELYEMSFITYHRTDSLNLSELILKNAKDFIISNFGSELYKFRKFKTKTKLSQEAHEAIRPTFPENTPKKLENKLNKNQIKLYDLIWRRFIASQMKAAIFDSLKVEIKAGKYIFETKGQTLKFSGFLEVYPIKFEEEKIPNLELNEILNLEKIFSSQHFTQPPARYNEASLIKELEKNGIGRPSTYAPIISTIQERNYVEKDEKRNFKPTRLGILVSDILTENFPEIVDLEFTAKMESNLDKIAAGQVEWQRIIKEFYDNFSKKLKEKEKNVQKKNIETGEKCPKCGAPLVIKISKYGEFLACSNFPKCDYKRKIIKTTKIKCPKCKKGEIIEKRTKKGKIFWACSEYPKCDFATWFKPTGEFCPKCTWPLVTDNKGNKVFCSNKKCDFKKEKK